MVLTSYYVWYRQTQFFRSPPPPSFFLSFSFFLAFGSVAFSMPPHMNESFSKGATFTRRCHTQSYGRVFLHRDKNARHIDSLQLYLGAPFGGWIQRTQSIMVPNVRKKLRNKRKLESNNIPSQMHPRWYTRTLQCSKMLFFNFQRCTMYHNTLFFGFF
jgi:hypothetical protein